MTKARRQSVPCFHLVCGSMIAVSMLALGCDAGTSSVEPEPNPGAGATGGTMGGGTGGSGMAGTGNTGTGGSGGTTTVGAPGFGTPNQVGAGMTSDRWHKTSVSRDGTSYFLMANGWGMGFGSQTLTWNGTSFTVVNMTGSQGSDYSPASYPTVFCGEYSDSRSQQCGLPAPISEISTLWTGWRWSPGSNPQSAQYNAAYDIWLSNTASVSGHSSYLMVWLRDPPGQRPAGGNQRIATVEGVPGTWEVWTGSVNGKPIVNYVRKEGTDLHELEFDVMKFINDAAVNNHNLPGSHIISVAVGFEIWNGPVSNLVSEDFYVQVN